MNTAKLIRRALTIVFHGALLMGGFGAYLALKRRALEEATHKSRVLLVAAMAMQP